MPVTVQYDADGRLTLEGLSCACGCEHHPLTQDIYVGRELIARIPSMIRRRGLGEKCVLVADNVTYEVAGRAVEAALTGAGFEVRLCVLRREGELQPDETAVGEVLLTLRADTEFLVAVGSGSVTDTTRINATRCRLPFVSVGTAPSMDGYMSVVAPVLLRNVKTIRPAVCPEIVVCDLDILATAPDDMIASGVGDVLGKYIAICDWRISHAVTGEAYCPVCAEIVLTAVDKLVKNADAIRRRTPEGMRMLIEGLLLAGVTIMVNGGTRAVACIEHNIAQFWEMKQLARGKTPPAHGSSVGVATLLVWDFYARFAQEDLSRIDLAAVRKARMPRETRVRWMLHAYGEDGGAAIMNDYPDDFISWETQEARIRAAQANMPAIREAIADLPPKQALLDAMRTLGAHLTPEEEGIDPELLNLSMWCGKDFRARYTLFKTIDECGLLPEYLSDYPYPFC